MCIVNCQRARQPCTLRRDLELGEDLRLRFPMDPQPPENFEIVEPEDSDREYDWDPEDGPHDVEDDEEEYYDLPPYIPRNGRGGGDARSETDRTMRFSFGNVQHGVRPPPELGHAMRQEANEVRFVVRRLSGRVGQDDGILERCHQWVRRTWTKVDDYLNSPKGFMIFLLFLLALAIVALLGTLKLHMQKILLDGCIEQFKKDPILGHSSLEHGIEQMEQEIDRIQTALEQKLAIVTAQSATIQKETGYFSANYFLQKFWTVYTYIRQMFLG